MWFEHGTSHIFYEEEGNGAPVLLLPGWSQSSNDIPEIKKALLGAGYRVIAADLPGSGRSLPIPREYTPAYLEDDAASFAALLDHLAPGPAHLIGFSDGGNVVQLMAVLTPAVARSLVTWGSVGVRSDPGGHGREGMFNMVDNPPPPNRAFRDHLVSEYGEANARAMTQSFARGLNDTIEAGGDISLSRAGNITCPVLLITGELDMLAPPALLSNLAAAIHDVEMHIAEGAGHDVNAEKPEWLAQTTLGWLATR